jgi:MFS family permease
MAREIALAGHLKPRSAPWMLASLSICMLLSSLGVSIANVALPPLARTFGAPFQQVQWVVLAYLLGVTALIVSVGRLGDIVGRRRLLLVGLAVFTAATGACGLAPSLPLLIAARGVQGLGAAIMMALTVAFVGEAVPKDRTGAAMGLLGTTSAIGTALGPSLGGLLIATLGWRAIFLICALVGVLALCLAHRVLPADHPERKAERGGFDAIGTLLLALTLAAYALAMTLGRGAFGPLNLALLAAALVGAGLFGIAQTKVASPLIPLATFRDPGLGAGLASSLLVSTVMMATLVVGPFYLSRALALEPAVVGLVMSVGPLVAALTGMPAGRLVDRFGARRMTASGLVGMTIGVLAPRGRDRRLCRIHRRHHRRVRLVPGGQQHRRDGRHRSRAARRHLRHAQPVAQSGPRHRSLGHGRGVRLGLGRRRHRHGGSRGRGARSADHLRRRGRADRPGDRHRRRKPSASLRGDILTQGLWLPRVKVSRVISLVGLELHR